MKNLLHLATGLVIITILFSCNDTSNYNLINSKKDFIFYDEIANNNPYDTLGMQHNLTLGAFMSEVDTFAVITDDTIDFDLSNNKILDWLKYYFIANNNIDPSNYYNLPFNLTYFDIAWNPDSCFDIINNSILYSSLFKDIMNSYITNISTVDTTADQIISMTHIFEDSVSLLLSLSNQEKNCLYCVFAIGKYSAYFWDNYLNANPLCFYLDVKNKGYQKIEMILKPKKHEKVVANLTISDATGAYVGFLTGIAGGPVGMAVGAGVGGVASSAVSGFLMWVGL
jgi:hypothetical protein